MFIIIVIIVVFPLPSPFAASFGYFFIAYVVIGSNRCSFRHIISSLFVFRVLHRDLFLSFSLLIPPSHKDSRMCLWINCKCVKNLEMKPYDFQFEKCYVESQHPTCMRCTIFLSFYFFFLFFLFFKNIFSIYYSCAVSSDSIFSSVSFHFHYDIKIKRDMRHILSFFYFFFLLFLLF